MTYPSEVGAAHEFSLFSLGTILVRNRWRISRWSLVFGVLAGLSVIGKPKVYRATASFIPQGADASRSSLANLATQFGVSIPSSGQSLTPDFYYMLVKAPVLLREIARDTFTVAESNGARVPFMELFGIQGDTPAIREENAVRALSDMTAVSLARTTNVIEVAVATKWPSVSLAITEALLRGVNDFNLRSRQSQAGEERKFVEVRLTAAGDDLRMAEDRLARFLASNRQYESAPELRFQEGRLERDLTMRQNVYNSLSTAYEDVRLREVRDTPLITQVEPPTVAAHAQPRGRVVRVAIGLMLGAVLGALVSLLSVILARRRREGDVEVNEFIGALREFGGGMVQRMPWTGARH